MSIRGGESQQVDVSSVTAYPTNPQIDLTAGVSMSASAYLLTNLHASVRIYVAEDRLSGEFAIMPGSQMVFRSGASRLWVRAQATGTAVKLEWSAT